MNLITVINSQYVPFAKIFFRSLMKLSDYNNIEKIFVVDAGLTASDKATIYGICKKVTICESGLDIDKSVMHTPGWRDVVSLKLRSFEWVTKRMNNIFPMTMIDVDSYFKDNFLHLINSSSDITVCKREKSFVNLDGYTLTHIGSFFTINNYSKGIIFLRQWMRTMKKLEGDHIETPALCSMLNIYRDTYNIDEVDQCVVSSDTFTDKCRIFHLKSDGPGSTASVEYRINKLRQHINIDRLLK